MHAPLSNVISESFSLSDTFQAGYVIFEAARIVLDAGTVCVFRLSCNKVVESGSRISFGYTLSWAQKEMTMPYSFFLARRTDEIYNKLLLSRKMPLVILFIISQRWVGEEECPLQPFLPRHPKLLHPSSARSLMCLRMAWALRAEHKDFCS